VTVATHPVQTECCHRGGQAPTAVTLRAYEVYAHVFGPQEAMITGECRGGFGIGELIAFLYAHSFPREEWRARVDEAFNGFKVGLRR
jgi:hypothetical protein